MNTIAWLFVLMLLSLGSAACKRDPTRAAQRGREHQVTLQLAPPPLAESSRAKPSAGAPAGAAPSAIEPATEPSAAELSARAAELSVAAAELSAAAQASAAPGMHGAPSPRCVHGWVTPERGTPLRKAALDMMRARPGEIFVVSEMRYFVGPEDAEVIGSQGPVERWYVKAHTLSKPGRRQRWLIRRARVGSGIDAIAAYDSRGYGPRTWKRIDTKDENLADPFLLPCDRAAANEKCMGLPREVLGCLDGT